MPARMVHVRRQKPNDLYVSIRHEKPNKLLSTRRQKPNKIESLDFNSTTAFDILGRKYDNLPGRPKGGILPIYR